MLRVVSLALVLMTVASCATMVSYENARDSLRSSGVCCESIAQFKYEQLAGDGDVSFNLDASSDAFNFQTGKSYFKAFRLPEKALPYRIKITSYALGEQIHNAHIFYPQVALLDDRFAIVRQSAPGDFSLRKVKATSETWGLPVKLEGSILVDTPNAKYVLVFTTQTLMRGASPYVTPKIVPIIVPGIVGAIPVGEETVLIRHSPFGQLHIEITRADAMTCPHGSEADIEPKNAITAKLVERDARLFVETVEPGVDTTQFDAIVILRGQDVLGGTVAIVLKDGCFVGRKFLSTLDYIHAIQMVTLFKTNPALKHNDRLEMATLLAMAETGDPAAQFHVGLTFAWGRGVPPDRGVAIEWLKRAAQRGFAPAMLALGMALSGPGALADEVEKVGQPPRSDEFTDLVTAYFWLDAASRSSEPDIKGEASFRLRELSQRMTPEELSKAKALVRERKATPH